MTSRKLPLIAPRRPRHPGRRRWPWALLAALAGLAGLLTVLISSLPSSAQVARLRTEPLRETAMMAERRGEAARRGRKLTLRWQPVPLAQIAPAVSAAVIASEDARFFEHGGIDFVQLETAVRERLGGGRAMRGASTLSQQLAKNLWLSGDRSVWRKLKEALIARRLEQELPKTRILELYLNAAEWGEGVFGIQAGAQLHFHKNALELSLAQSAALAALLPSPLKLPSLKANWYQRARHVLDRIAQEHLAPPEQVLSARLELALDFGQAPPKPTEPTAPEPSELESDSHEEP